MSGRSRIPHSAALASYFVLGLLEVACVPTHLRGCKHDLIPLVLLRVESYEQRFLAIHSLH